MLFWSGYSVADVLHGEKKDSQRQWILAMGGASAMVTPPALGKIKTKKSATKFTDQGVVNPTPFRDRVIRDKRYKLYIDANRKPIALVDVSSDPEEKKIFLDQNTQKP